MTKAYRFETYATHGTERVYSGVLHSHKTLQSAEKDAERRNRTCVAQGYDIRYQVGILPPPEISDEPRDPSTVLATVATVLYVLSVGFAMSVSLLEDDGPGDPMPISWESGVFVAVLSASVVLFFAAMYVATRHEKKEK